MSNNYGSANQFTTESFLDPYNIFMPQNRRELIGFQQDEYFMSEIFQQLQMTEPVEGNKWFTWVEPKKIEYLTATSSASAGGSDGAAVDVVINATSGISGGVYARLGDVYRRSNGEELLVVAINKGTRTITFKPNNSTTISAVAAGETFVKIGTAYPEASDPSTPMTGRARQITNTLQIQQEIAQVSGSVQTDKTWFEVDTPSLDGTTVKSKYWFSWEVKAAYDRMMYSMNNTLLVGDGSTYDISSYATSFGSKAQSSTTTTTGLIPQIANEGGAFTYAPGEPSMNWFFKVINQLIKNQGDKENVMFNGMQFTQANISWITDQMKNGAISYGAFTGGKEMALKIGFNSFEVGGFTFHWKDMPMFNFPQGLGEQGFSQRSILLPVTPIRTSTGSMAKPVRLRYKQVQGSKMLGVGFRQSTRNNMNPTAAGDYDSVELIADWGAELLAPWKSLDIKPIGVA